MPKRGSLLILRHGESTANAADLFTGILDVGMTEVGFAQARIAADLVRATQFPLDVVFVSELLRAKQTAATILDVLNLTALHPIADWRLNERNYGALTGRSKQEVLAEYGEPLFRSWRRSVNVAPPPMPDEQFAALASSPPFSKLPAAALTCTESLADVITRVHAFYTQRVLPELFAGSNVLIVGHGNSLRALCAELDQLTTKEVEVLNIPTGQPLLYEFDAALTPSTPLTPWSTMPRRNRYLDPVTALSAATVIAQQGGT